MSKKVFCFALCSMLFPLCFTADAQQEDLWDPDRPEPTVAFKETKAIAQALKKLPDKIKQFINRKGTTNQEESDSLFEQVGEMDSNEIQRRSIDDLDVRNRLKFDTMPALEDSRHLRTLAIWTLVLAILAGFYALVMKLMRRLFPSYSEKRPLSRDPK